MTWTPARIKKLRERLGLTQAEFGDAIGVTQQSVQRWESGERNVSQLASRELDRKNSEQPALKKNTQGVE